MIDAAVFGVGYQAACLTVPVFIQNQTTAGLTPGS